MRGKILTSHHDLINGHSGSHVSRNLTQKYAKNGLTAPQLVQFFWDRPCQVHRVHLDFGHLRKTDPPEALMSLTQFHVSVANEATCLSIRSQETQNTPVEQSYSRHSNANCIIPLKNAKCCPVPSGRCRAVK